MTATPAGPEAPASIYVSIVSNNPETLDGLHAYLSGAGVSSHCTRVLDTLDDTAVVCVTATVIFPDDFPEWEVLKFVHDLRRARPRTLALLVTREPQRFLSVQRPDRRSLRLIVLPKPSFGWDILDAIRTHASAG